MIHISYKENCCGCSACESVCSHLAIVMCADSEGFLYPKVNETLCVNCGLCDFVCPINNDNSHSLPSNIFAAKNKNTDILYKSSSGGVFTPIADYIISREGVVYGASYLDNWKVTHTRATTIDETESFRGSKYVQSDLVGIFPQIKRDLLNGLIVLFVGTPCQVYGLIRYLRKHYDNLFTCDIICHGVPSPKVFRSYINYIETKYKRSIVGINMKDKTNGWGHQTLRIFFDDGTNIFSNKESDLWNKLFYSNLITRPSCHKCKFANYGRVGDISIGDFWGIEKSHPDFYDKNGVSLIFINNKNGQIIFDNIKESLEYIHSNKEECMQPNLESPTDINRYRNQFWHFFSFLSFNNVCKIFIPNSIIERVISKFIRVICSLMKF